MEAQRGFSLIELMVVVAIVGILAAVALPAYGNYVMRGKITEALTNLGDMRIRMEQYYQDNRTYLNGAACGAAFPTGLKYFTIGCVATANTYTITATGITGVGLGGFAYTIDQTNTKTSAITAPATANGWANPNPNNCWTIKPGGTC